MKKLIITIAPPTNKTVPPIKLPITNVSLTFSVAISAIIKITPKEIKINHTNELKSPANNILPFL